MNAFWIMLARPFLYLIVFAPIVAFGVWRVRKMKDGRLKRFLLWPDGNRPRARQERP